MNKKLRIAAKVLLWTGIIVMPFGSIVGAAILLKGSSKNEKTGKNSKKV